MDANPHLPIETILSEISVRSAVSPTIRQEAEAELASMLTSEQQERAKAGLSEEMVVYPDVTPLYKIISFSGDSPSTYYINLSENTCSCEYFLYNCSNNEKYCKHIWRVLTLVKHDCLPSSDESTYKWIFDRLTAEIDTQFEQNNMETYNRLQDIEKRLITDGPKVNYEYILYEWANARSDDLNGEIINPFDIMHEHMLRNPPQ